MQENVKIEIETNMEGYRENVSTQPLQRCSKKGVEDFIAEEASSYKCDNIGTIHNSIAKKAVDADLRTEKKEIDQGVLLSNDVGLERRVERSFPSEISADKIIELLTTQINKWSFQTSNSHKLNTFYAKGEKPSIELFINFKNEGDRSYICFGHSFGYLDSKVLFLLKEKLTQVYSIITEEVDKKELVWERVDINNSLSKFEKVKLEDPDSWNDTKYIALQEFISRDPGNFEKILNFFGMNNAGSVSLYHLLKEDTLTDSTAENYLLDSIKIDVKQIYA